MTTAPDPDPLTREVLARFADTPDPRLREVLSSLVRHLHAFARDVRLTEAEWMQGIRFLTATGHLCDDRRQEFILLSDVLGLSMQVVGLAAPRAAGATEATVFGPFHVEGAPELPHGADAANGAPGRPCAVHLRVGDTDGAPIAGAVVDVWQADDEGLYDVQRDGLAEPRNRAVLRTGEDGRLWFRAVVPEPYPIPTDGPVGALLQATRRSPWRPAHLHVRIRAEGFETLITHVFRRGDPHLATDPVFGVRESLVSDWPVSADGACRLDFDFVLARAA